MGKRILDILTGALTVVVGSIVALAVFRRSTPKVNTNRHNDKPDDANNKPCPPSDGSPIKLLIEATIHHHGGNGPQQPICNKNDQKFSLRRTFADPATYMVIGTLIIAGAAVLQYHHSDNTAKRQLRAYLLASYAELKEPDKEGNIVVSVTFKNSGQTPACDMKVNATFTYDDRDNPASSKKHSSPEGEEPSSYNVGAGDNAWSDDTLTADEIVALKAKRLLIRVSGVATYSDIFKELHHTAFSFYSDLSMGIQSHHFYVSDTGNKID